jgi:hypothetical protein
MKNRIFLGLFFLLFRNSFCMQSVIVDTQEESSSENLLVRADGQCAFCCGLIDEGVMKTLSCWPENIPTQCPSCKVFFHKKCLKKILFQLKEGMPSAELLNCPYCPNDVAMLLKPTGMQQFTQWCRDHILALYALFYLDAVAITLVHRYSSPSAAYVGLALAGILLCAFSLGLVPLTHEESYTDTQIARMKNEEKRLLMLTALGVTTVGGVLALSYIL